MKFRLLNLQFQDYWRGGGEWLCCMNKVSDTCTIFMHHCEVFVVFRHSHKLPLAVHHLWEITKSASGWWKNSGALGVQCYTNSVRGEIASPPQTSTNQFILGFNLFNILRAVSITTDVDFAFLSLFFSLLFFCWICKSSCLWNSLWISMLAVPLNTV